MKIYPKIGIDGVRLGMNKAQVQEVLGKPSLIEKGSQNEYWQYDQGLDLLFQKEDLYLLGTITITNSAGRRGSACGSNKAVATQLIHKAGFTHATARTGAVTLIQRFGGALNLNVPQGTLS